jgi:cobalamin biosynthesis protein CobT
MSTPDSTEALGCSFGCVGPSQRGLRDDDDDDDEDDDDDDDDDDDGDDDDEEEEEEKEEEEDDADHAGDAGDAGEYDSDSNNARVTQLEDDDDHLAGYPRRKTLHDYLKASMAAAMFQAVDVGMLWV